MGSKNSQLSKIVERKWISETIRTRLYKWSQFFEESDLRGSMVYDCKHKKIGTISEIYYNKDDHHPEYVEITPLSKLESSGSLMYPIDYIKWSKEGKPTIDSKIASLKRLEDYQYDFVMSHLGDELIPYYEEFNL